MECDNAKAIIRHSHLSVLLPLQKQLLELNRQFPETLEAYQAMEKNNHDAQLKVARFLMASGQTDRQEKMLTESGWAWRQVQPLLNIFKENVSNCHPSTLWPG